MTRSQSKLNYIINISMIYKNNTFPRNNAHIIHVFILQPPRMFYHISPRRCTKVFLPSGGTCTTPPRPLLVPRGYILCPLHCVFTSDPCVAGGTSSHIRYWYLRDRSYVRCTVCSPQTLVWPRGTLIDGRDEWFFTTKKFAWIVFTPWYTFAFSKCFVM